MSDRDKEQKRLLRLHSRLLPDSASKPSGRNFIDAASFCARPADATITSRRLPKLRPNCLLLHSAADMSIGTQHCPLMTPAILPVRNPSHVPAEGHQSKSWLTNGGAPRACASSL